MTGQDIQDKLDALVVDLQTKGKGQTVQVSVRDVDNSQYVLPLSSDANGVVNNAQLVEIQSFVTQIVPVANAYNAAIAPVRAASEAFKLAQAPHEALITAASTARTNLQTALDADPDYNAAKTALDGERNDAGYIAARDNYAAYNVSEIFGNLGDAKGKYIAV